jgi:hypothetical protein
MEWNVFTLISFSNANKLWQNEKYNEGKQMVDKRFVCGLCFYFSLLQLYINKRIVSLRQPTNIDDWRARDRCERLSRMADANNTLLTIQFWPVEQKQENGQQKKSKQASSSATLMPRAHLWFPFTKRYYSGNVDRVIFSHNLFFPTFSTSLSFIFLHFFCSRISLHGGYCSCSVNSIDKTIKGNEIMIIKRTKLRYKSWYKTCIGF